MADDRDDDRLEEDRAAILRRRAVFVASAVAGLGLAAGCGESTPAACLDVSPSPTETGAPSASTATPPQPCLDIQPAPQPCLEIAAPQDAGVEQSIDAGPDAGPTPPQPCLRKPPPRPCLKVAAPPPPQACLDMPPPSDE